MQSLFPVKNDRDIKKFAIQESEPQGVRTEESRPSTHLAKAVWEQT